MYNYLNTIQTPLAPIEKYDWQQMHEWVYHEMGKRLITDNIFDVGCGCGLLGAFLIHYNYCKHVVMYETDEVYLNYARALVETMGLTAQIEILPIFYTSAPKLQNTTIVATRLGPLTEFEKIIGNNRAMTIRRTEEVEPYFIRESTKVWHGEIIRRTDGFELEVLTR